MLSFRAKHAKSRVDSIPVFYGVILSYFQCQNTFCMFFNFGCFLFCCVNGIQKISLFWTWSLMFCAAEATGGTAEETVGGNRAPDITAAGEHVHQGSECTPPRNAETNAKSWGEAAVHMSCEIVPNPSSSEFLCSSFECHAIITDASFVSPWFHKLLYLYFCIFLLP
jgi:hypothetical protein